MPSAVWATMQIPLGGRPVRVISSGCGRCGILPRSKCREDGIEMSYDGILSTDHEAVAAFQPKHPAAGPAVDVVQPLVADLFGPPEVIDIVRVAAVDEDVSCVEERRQVVEHFVA